MFDISNDAADWIQDNLYLIDDGDLQQIVKKCPAKIVGEVLLAMDDVGAEIEEDPNSTEMWGIKSSSGYRTVSLGKHNKTNFNINFTASEGMKGGMQIGFKSVSACIQFIKRFGSDAEHYRPSRMQPKTVSEYTWKEVDTIYGKCWITNLAFDKYDPASAAARTLLKKANGYAVKKIAAQISPLLGSISEALLSRFGKWPEASRHSCFDFEVRLYDIATDHSKLVLFIRYINAKESDIPEIQKIIKNVADLDTTVSHSYFNREGLLASLNLDISSNKLYKDIQAEAYAKYGINP